MQLYPCQNQLILWLAFVLELIPLGSFYGSYSTFGIVCIGANTIGIICMGAIVPLGSFVLELIPLESFVWEL